MVKININLYILYIPSLHHAIHTLNNVAHIMENKKNRESHSHRNMHEEITYAKNMEKHWNRICMTKIRIQKLWKVIAQNIHDKTHIKQNGSPSYRNVHDDNRFKNR